MLTSQRLADNHSYHDKKTPSWKKLRSLKINFVNSVTTCHKIILCHLKYWVMIILWHVLRHVLRQCLWIGLQVLSLQRRPRTTHSRSNFHTCTSHYICIITVFSYYYSKTVYAERSLPERYSVFLRQSTTSISTVPAMTSSNSWASNFDTRRVSSTWQTVSEWVGFNVPPDSV